MTAGSMILQQMTAMWQGHARRNFSTLADAQPQSTTNCNKFSERKFVKMRNFPIMETKLNLCVFCYFRETQVEN
jgi:hypothetical protein